MKKIFLVFIIFLVISGCAKIDLDSSQYSEKNNESFSVNGKKIVAHFIDVGQGDANFIELPNDKVMLIDAGVASSSTKIINYIKNLGYTKIDYVVATHPHADHIGGLSEVISSFDIGQIYMPKAVSTSKTYENLLLTIKDKGLTIKTGKAGIEILNEDNLKIIIMAPNGEKYTNLNNYSIILKIIYGDVSLLYTGDAEIESLNEIEEDISASILKVGHHGSDTSTTKEFLEKVKPKYAIISVGEDNSYGHPATSTIKLLKEYTNNIYRTDLNGDVVISSDGINIELETER